MSRDSCDSGEGSWIMQPLCLPVARAQVTASGLVGPQQSWAWGCQSCKGHLLLLFSWGQESCLETATSLLVHFILLRFSETKLRSASDVLSGLWSIMFWLDAIHLTSIYQNLRKYIGKNATYPDFFCCYFHCTGNLTQHVEYNSTMLSVFTRSVINMILQILIKVSETKHLLLYRFLPNALQQCVNKLIGSVNL